LGSFMNEARWEEVKRVFAAALRRPLSERQAFLRAACEGDAELQAEVQNLLLGDEHALSFLDSPAIEIMACEQPRMDRSLAVGDVLSSRFEIVRFLGEGGMGQVYEALDRELDEHIAVKAIRPEIASDPHVLLRFKHEVQLTRRITHPNICRTFDFERHDPGRAEGLASEISFLTMELLKGETLADLLRREDRLEPENALPLLKQMAAALAAAHDSGVIHRDFKPSNVFLVRSESGLRVVVTDFGLAEAALPPTHFHVADRERSLMATGKLLGTLAYMSPEQLELGEATPSSDVYALGLVIYEMVTGKRPFADSTPLVEAVKRLREAAPSPRRDFPSLAKTWEAVIDRCLQADPAARFQTAQQVIDAITCSERAAPLVSLPGLRPSDKASAGKSRRIQSWNVRWIGASVLVCAVALLVASLRYYWVKEDSRVAAGSSVLLTDIANSTGDSRFVGITELMRQQLLQSPHFNLMDTHRVQELMLQMTRSVNVPLDPPTAREVALRGGAARVIFGAVSRVGGSFVLNIVIEEPESNVARARHQWEHHWTWSAASGANSEKIVSAELLDIIRDSSDWIRSTAGEAANDIARFDAPPEDATTDKWDALLEFAQAERLNRDAQRENAVVALQKAVRVDPQFALAYMRLGDILVSLRRYEDGFTSYQQALAAATQRRLTDREKYRLKGIYAIDTGNFAAADAAFLEYRMNYQQDYLGWFYRAYPLMMLGRVEEAIGTLETAAKLDPSRVSAPAHIARFYLILDETKNASPWIEMLRRQGHADDAAYVAGESEFLQGYFEQAAILFAGLRLSSDHFYRTRSYILQACLAAELGKYDDAIRYLDEGLAADIGEGDTADYADKLLDKAYLETMRRHYPESLEYVRKALKLDRSFPRSIAASEILGMAVSGAKGNLRRELIAELRDMEAKLPRGNYQPISAIARHRIHGELLLARGQAKAALEEFTQASSQDAPANDRWYLARALLAAAAGEPDAAAKRKQEEDALEVYTNLITHPGQIWQDADNYLPGYFSDAVLAYAQLAAQLGRFDDHAKNQLELYVARRSHADPNVGDVDKVKEILRHPQRAAALNNYLN
jgi:serine/threonine protein kinase/tetratricopeptide (TPR) repeat protein